MHMHCQQGQRLVVAQPGQKHRMLGPTALHAAPRANRGPLYALLATSALVATAMVRLHGQAPARHALTAHESRAGSAGVLPVLSPPNRNPAAVPSRHDPPARASPNAPPKPAGAAAGLEPAAASALDQPAPARPSGQGGGLQPQTSKPNHQPKSKTPSRNIAFMPGEVRKVSYVGEGPRPDEPPFTCETPLAVETEKWPVSRRLGNSIFYLANALV